MASPSFTLSADGKLLDGHHIEIERIAVGDTVRLVIDGNRMTGGADSPTLLGNGHTFLPSSHQFVLTEFEPQADGRCRLGYTLISPLPE